MAILVLIELTQAEFTSKHQCTLAKYVLCSDISASSSICAKLLIAPEA